MNHEKHEAHERTANHPLFYFVLFVPFVVPQFFAFLPSAVPQRH